jgi:hypothetical protein
MFFDAGQRRPADDADLRFLQRKNYRRRDLLSHVNIMFLNDKHQLSSCFKDPKGAHCHLS